MVLRLKQNEKKVSRLTQNSFEVDSNLFLDGWERALRWT